MRTHRRFLRPRVERLEPRQMLTAGGVVTLDEGGLLSIVGSNKKDRIEVLFEADEFHVRVNGKKDSFAAASVLALKIDGGSGDDCITVADSVLLDALIYGGNGHDKIRGGSGHDVILSGTGHDHVDGGAGSDYIDGGEGHDKLSGGGDGDTLLGGVGHDALSGGAGDDTLQGDVGNDKLSGGDGNDALSGGDGHDKLCGDAGNDVLDGGKGHDKLKAGEGDDSLLGGEGHDDIFGEAGNDWLDGGDGHDKLCGGDGDDRLKGGAGNDKLDGGAGANLLDGDSGTSKLKNGVEYDFENPPPPPPEEDPFQAFAANLTPWNSTVSQGTASWERQTTAAGLETFLLVSLHGQGAGLFLPVFIGSSDPMWVGEIEVGADGTGFLKLSNQVDEPGEQPFPTADFAVTAGLNIWIGEGLSGTFAAA